MREITTTATYGIKIYADGVLVTDRELAEYVLFETFGDQAVVRNAQADRWAISVRDHCRLANAIERKGFARALTKLQNGTGVSWL